MTDDLAEPRGLPPVAIPAFSGPLDLLLHLIRKNEVSIIDIPILEITEQYTAFLETMRELDLDVASDYVALQDDAFVPPWKFEFETAAGREREAVLDARTRRTQVDDGDAHAGEAALHRLCKPHALDAPSLWCCHGCGA
jgi:hypothetical protein